MCIVKPIDKLRHAKGHNSFSTGVYFVMKQILTYTKYGCS